MIRSDEANGVVELPKWGTDPKESPDGLPGTTRRWPTRPVTIGEIRQPLEVLERRASRASSRKPPRPSDGPTTVLGEDRLSFAAATDGPTSLEHLAGMFVPLYLCAPRHS